MSFKEQQEPLITIVVPIYNGEQYIEQCTNSILNQDYKNIELILVDDGSTDNSRKIAENLKNKDTRVKLILQDNSGVSVARNNGINNCHGEYIGFVDVDDYIEKDYISYLYNLIKENSAEISIVPQPRKFNSLSNITQKEKIDIIETWTGVEAAKEMLYYNVAIGPWNKIISKKLIDEYNIRFHPELAFGEGFNFSVDCFQRAEKVAVGHRKLYNYRVDNSNSVMTKFSIKLVNGSIEAQKTIKENLVEETPELLKACKYANWHTYCDCLNTIIGCKMQKKYSKEYKQIKKICKKDALCVFNAEISKKEKIKGILYLISPYITARIINHFRIRKFTIEQ